jgi:hypothetical protein
MEITLAGRIILDSYLLYAERVLCSVTSFAYTSYELHLPIL